MSSTKPRATVKSATPIATGFLKLTRYEFETGLHAGGLQIVTREVMERGHAIAILPYDPKRDEVVLVNEFRPGCLIAGDDAFTDNLAAGGIGNNETAFEAAVRETKEETGLELTEPMFVHPGAYVSSGGTSEKIAIVAGLVDATNAGGIHGLENESEDILCVVVSAEEFIRRARSAEIADLKTLLAAYWLAENRERLRAQSK